MATTVRKPITDTNAVVPIEHFSCGMIKETPCPSLGHDLRPGENAGKILDRALGGRLQLEMVHSRLHHFVDLRLAGVDFLRSPGQLLRLAFGGHIGKPIRGVEHDYAAEALMDDV